MLNSNKNISTLVILQKELTFDPACNDFRNFKSIIKTFDTITSIYYIIPEVYIPYSKNAHQINPCAQKRHLFHFPKCKL